jgi:ferredoxin
VAPSPPQTGSLALGALVALAFLWAAVVSWCEREERAARRLLLLGIVLAFPLLGVGPLGGPLGSPLASLLLLLAGLFLAAILLPLPGRQVVELGRPVPGVDERDIMFSRARLVPGTEQFEAYYRRHPESRDKDDRFRREPGLLAPGSAHFHPLGFAAADAAFWTIERLRPFIAGDPATTAHERLGPAREDSAEPEASRPLPPPEGRPAPIGAHPSQDPDPAALTRFLKAWALKLGAHSVGVTALRDYHLYSHVGRGADYGKPVGLAHPFALALAVEMDREMVDAAPRSPTVMESAHQYLRSGTMAVQLAETIRRLGYRARAHVDGRYRLICPLVARDAGLGEIGRMGLLMTPRLGPRVRIAVVTTDIPLLCDRPRPDPTVLDFCARCRKCAEACPARALPLGPPLPDREGVVRWKIDAEACFTLWTRLGTDCARCMAVCPYSHPDNLLHGLVRRGIRNNALFRRGAVWMDDLVYGRRPPAKPLPSWMDQGEAAVPASLRKQGGDP